MAKFALTDAYILINAVALSGATKSVTLSTSADTVDGSGMGQGTHLNLAGLKDWTLAIEFEQDFAAASVNATLFPLVGLPVPIEIRPTSAARSVTNPAFTGTGLLANYTPISGSVGDLAMAPVSIVAASALAMQTA